MHCLSPDQIVTSNGDQSITIQKNSGIVQIRTPEETSAHFTLLFPSRCPISFFYLTKNEILIVPEHELARSVNIESYTNNGLLMINTDDVPNT